MFEPAAEAMPRAELKALQLSRLKATVERAYHKVPHYKKKFDAANVKPADLKSLADLARFPFTVKTDLRDNYPFGMFAVPREQLAAPARLVGHHRQADRRRLHQGRPRSLGRPDGALPRRMRRAARRDRA